MKDRLSELPDSLILVILSLLPMKDVVRTTLLSKRWKDLWTTVPCLDFTDDINDSGRFEDFVNRALILWKGTKILKFKVDFPYDISLSSHLDLWLRVALENEVEELYVNLIEEGSMSCGDGDDGYWAPQRLFSCSSIRKLSLAGCQLKIRGNVQWDRLKCLTIDCVPMSDHVINQVLSGTPQLEILILHLSEIYENLNIRSSSLKKLTIEKYFQNEDEDDEEVVDTVLTISAPNVRTLEILGFQYTKIKLMNILSLTNAAIHFDYDIGYNDNSQFPAYKLLQDILGHVHHSTHPVEKVTLSDWSIKVLGEMKKKDMLAPLSDAKFLKLRASKVDDIVGLLDIFTKLTMLVLEDRILRINDYSDIFEIVCDVREPSVTSVENSLESKTDFPKSCLLHLTTVEITSFYCNNSIFPVIEFLLKYASKLEKLVLWVTGSRSLKPESLLLTAEKLLRMPRSSPNAEVILRKK